MKFCISFGKYLIRFHSVAKWPLMTDSKEEHPSIGIPVCGQMVANGRDKGYKIIEGWNAYPYRCLIEG